jgi:glycosyltransferase involved in cell wall biosynthesis
MSNLVSIIVAAYNCEQFIRQSLDSLLNQSYENIEIIIADDSSTDKTKTIIDSYSDKRIKRYHNNKNLGYLKTCNKLFTKCLGSYITFQDADDWSKQNRIQKHLSFMLHYNLDISTCGYDKVSTDGKFLYTFFPTELKSDFIQEINETHFVRVCGASIMIKREVLHSVGNYRLFFDRIGSEHLDWLLRMLPKHSIRNIQKPLYVYRDNPASISNEIDLAKPINYISGRIAFNLFEERMLNNGIDSLMGSNVNQEKITNHALRSFNIHGAFGGSAQRLIQSKRYLDVFKQMFSLLSLRPFHFYTYIMIFVTLLKILLGSYYRPSANFVKTLFKQT